MPTHDLSHWANALNNGEVIAYPTESVFGLGCIPEDEQAVRKILNLKQRPLDKGLIVITDELARIEHWFDDSLSEQQWQHIQSTWPGPITWLIPCNKQCPTWVRGIHTSIAVRIPAFPIARELCTATGSALISTSANPQGQPPAVNAQEVRNYFSDKIDSLDLATGGASSVSEIRDAVTEQIIRLGDTHE